MKITRIPPILAGLLIMAPVVNVFAADIADRARNQQASPVITAAGRNLRSSNSKSCQLTLPTKSIREPGPAQVVVMLPTGSKLLSAEIVKPHKTQGSCKTRHRETNAGIVRCTLNRLSSHQPITVVARYRQLSGSTTNCSGYLTKQLR